MKLFALNINVNSYSTINVTRQEIIATLKISNQKLGQAQLPSLTTAIYTSNFVQATTKPFFRFKNIVLEINFLKLRLCLNTNLRIDELHIVSD